MRLVQSSLRCYPQRWRSRHGEEAAELARLLMRDGKPARSIAWSYLKGAASARLVLQPRRRLRAAVGALLAAACSVCVSLALLSSSVPASAASVVRQAPSSSRHKFRMPPLRPMPSLRPAIVINDDPRACEWLPAAGPEATTRTSTVTDILVTVLGRLDGTSRSGTGQRGRL